MLLFKFWIHKMVSCIARTWTVQNTNMSLSQFLPPSSLSLSFPLSPSCWLSLAFLISRSLSRSLCFSLSCFSFTLSPPSSPPRLSLHSSTSLLPHLLFLAPFLRNQHTSSWRISTCTHGTGGTPRRGLFVGCTGRLETAEAGPEL